MMVMSPVICYTGPSVANKMRIPLWASTPLVSYQNKLIELVEQNGSYFGPSDTLGLDTTERRNITLSLRPVLGHVLLSILYV